MSCYQASQNGQIGLSLNTAWIVPYHDTPAGRAAANRTLAFTFGWYKHVILQTIVFNGN